MLANFSIEILDINDHAPKFDQNNYTHYLSEDTNNWNVIQVRATDEDLPNLMSDSITYFIKQDYGGLEQLTFNNKQDWVMDLSVIQDYFFIDKFTGFLKLKKPVDASKYKVFKIPVCAKDGDAEDSKTTCTIVTVIMVLSDNFKPIISLSPLRNLPLLAKPGRLPIKEN